jgi:nicotinate-nucleotide adenylyltransferase
MKSRIGVYSGTFDPIHQGHIAFAEEAMRVCKLDKVVFLPERRPRDKHTVTDITHRIALIERATSDTAAFHVLSLTSEQHTVKDTLPELHAAFGSVHLTFLMGSDIVRTFPHRWDGLDILFREVSFAIGMRTNDNKSEVAEIVAEMEHVYNTTIQHTYIHAPNADLTSSQIRQSSMNMSRLNSRMLEYIHEHKLYSQSLI